MGLFLAGRPVKNPLESLRLFAICRAMDWNHLPNAGGLYDQSPRLLDQWMYIWQKEAEKQELERAQAERQRKK